MRNLPFEKRLVRLEYRPVTGNPERIIDLVKKSGAKVLVSGAMDGSGYSLYRSKLKDVSPHPNLSVNYLPELITRAKENDIIVLSWYNLHENLPLSRKKIDWRVKYNGGFNYEKVFYSNVEKRGDLCLLSSPYQDFVRAYCREIIKDVGFDGLWLDGGRLLYRGLDYWPQNTFGCVCRYCQESFLKDTGYTIPKKINWDSKVFREFVRWRYRKFSQFIVNLEQELKKINPETIVVLNHYNRPEVSGKKCFDWKTEVPLDRMGFGGVAGSESVWGSHRLQSTSFNAKLVKAINPKSFEVWTPMMTFFNRPQDTTTKLETTALLIHGLIMASQGGAAFYGFSPRYLQPLREISSSIRKRQSWFGGEPLKYCALHLSQNSRDFYGKNKPIGYFQNVFGIYEMLVESHFFVDIVYDSQINYEELKSYKVLILPNSACLSEKQADEIRRFVKNGGTLVSTFKSSLYDEEGKERKDFLLRDVFGVKYSETIFLESGFQPAILHKKSLSDVLGDFIWFGDSRVEIDLDEKNGQEVLCTMSKITNEEEYEGQPISAIDSKRPAVIINPYGQGESIYLNADVGVGYVKWPYPAVRKLFSYLVKKAVVFFEIRAPKTVEATAFRKNGEIVVHLVNYPVYSNKPIYLSEETTPIIDEVLPIHNIEISVKDVKVKEALLPLQNSTLKLVKIGNDTRIEISTVHIHEIVVLRLD